jgi:hypothetical protein
MGGNRQLLVSRPRACARHGARALASGHKDHAGRTLPQKLLLHVLPTLQGPEVTLAHLQPHTSAQTSTNPGLHLPPTERPFLALLGSAGLRETPRHTQLQQSSSHAGRGES